MKYSLAALFIIGSLFAQDSLITSIAETRWSSSGGIGEGSVINSQIDYTLNKTLFSDKVDAINLGIGFLHDERESKSKPWLNSYNFYYAMMEVQRKISGNEKASINMMGGAGLGIYNASGFDVQYNASGFDVQYNASGSDVQVRKK